MMSERYPVPSDEKAFKGMIFAVGATRCTIPAVSVPRLVKHCGGGLIDHCNGLLVHVHGLGSRVFAIQNSGRRLIQVARLTSIRSVVNKVVSADQNWHQRGMLRVNPGVDHGDDSGAGDVKCLLGL